MRCSWRCIAESRGRRYGRMGSSHNVECANNGEPTYTCKRMRRKFAIDHTGKIKVSDWRPVPKPSFSDHACIAYNIHWDEDLERTAGEIPRERTKTKVTKFCYDNQRPTGKRSTKFLIKYPMNSTKFINWCRSKIISILMSFLHGKNEKRKGGMSPKRIKICH